MMAPTPYTRSAIQLIRNGASAADLGWSASFYGSVCASHGIARVAETAASPAVLPPPLKIIAQKPPKPPHGIELKFATGEITRHGIVVAASRVQARIFKALFEKYTGDQGYLSSTQMLAAIESETSAKNFRAVVYRLGARLTPMKIWIETRNGRDGGFRLRVEN